MKKSTVGRYLRKNIVNFGIIAVALVFVTGTELMQGTEAIATFGGSAPNISAQYAILADGKTGEVLYEKQADEKAYPASITKIMTAVVVLDIMEELKSPLGQKVEIPQTAVGIEGSSVYLAAGESVSIEDLLYGMMLRSGNDAAVALAEIVGGNKENFVKLMNGKAVELGCTGTHFTNPNGLYDERHYTTARDMVLISQYAMGSSVFREIAVAKEHTADREPDKYNYFYNKNKVVQQYEGGTGIKIGFTKASGRTLVASASREGRELICVVMNAPDWFNDAYALFDWGFAME